MLNLMARITLDMLLLRRGPQELPARRELLLLAVAVYVLVSGIAYLSIAEMNVQLALMQSITSLAYLATFVWIVLVMAGKRARFLQTFMGFVTTATLFNVLEVGPLMSLMPRILQLQALMQEAQTTGGDINPAALEAIQMPGLAMVLLLCVYMWRLIVMAHIFHHALEITRGRALALTLLFPAMVMFLALMMR